VELSSRWKHREDEEPPLLQLLMDPLSVLPLVSTLRRFASLTVSIAALKLVGGEGGGQGAGRVRRSHEPQTHDCASRITTNGLDEVQVQAPDASL
jgi:hypothetical protein